MWNRRPDLILAGRGGHQTMKGIGVVAIGAMSLTFSAARVAAQPPSVSGQGYAAVVNLATGTQQFAGAALPEEGGMVDADLDAAAVTSTLTASTLNSITTGMADSAVASAQTSAEAADVSILNGLITARQVLGVAASYINQQAAGSGADRSEEHTSELQSQSNLVCRLL